ncbi:MAG: hypothetical protein JF597_32165 [Streptomyces sp.]|jgi:hypothetical protein|uniref:hypothetical protein n=1 Tax=Streptomyces sp. TaxID=1931 RepID=UPI0025F39586|nr:hypothetical protein [Streptomyces sp.]MBW8798076.1 hypothetical protein [Streptomyces sp.]
MTTKALPTAVLPPPPAGPDRLPRPGAYTAAPDRCIVELTGRIGPLVTLRRRLVAADASLTVTPEPEHWALSLELTGRPLHGARFTFVSTTVASEDHGSRLKAVGNLALRDGPPTPAVLTLRVVERTDDALLVLGVLRLPYRPLHRATGLTLPRTRPADRVRLLVAAEFTCPA